MVLLLSSMLFLAGCGKSANEVFTIKLDGFRSGRPVVDIKPNSQQLPPGNGPFGDYFLVLRAAGGTPYTRQFDKDQAAKGVKLDFAVTKNDFKNGERITVAVENPQSGSFDKSVRLSNVIDVEFPGN